MQNIIQKEQELLDEIESWKETCEILSDQKVLSSIKRSLQQIEEGKEMALSKL